MTLQAYRKSRNYKSDATLFCACSAKATVIKGGYPACDRCAGIKSNTPTTSGIKYDSRGKHALN